MPILIGSAVLFCAFSGRSGHADMAEINSSVGPWQFQCKSYSYREGGSKKSCSVNAVGETGGHLVLFGTVPQLTDRALIAASDPMFEGFAQVDVQASHVCTSPDCSFSGDDGRKLRNELLSGSKLTVAARFKGELATVSFSLDDYRAALRQILAWSRSQSASEPGRQRSASP